jgi:type II secretory pathway predicted ATPase ExeA
MASGGRAMEVKLSDCIDSNYFVSVDGQYRQLRALVAHLEAKVAELEGTVSHPSCLAIDEARDEERQELQKLVRYLNLIETKCYPPEPYTREVQKEMHKIYMSMNKETRKAIEDG